MPGCCLIVVRLLTVRSFLPAVSGCGAPAAAFFTGDSVTLSRNLIAEELFPLGQGGFLIGGVVQTKLAAAAADFARVGHITVQCDGVNIYPRGTAALFILFATTAGAGTITLRRHTGILIHTFHVRKLTLESTPRENTDKLNGHRGQLSRWLYYHIQCRI